MDNMNIKLKIIYQYSQIISKNDITAVSLFTILHKRCIKHYKQTVGITSLLNVMQNILAPHKSVLDGYDKRIDFKKLAENCPMLTVFGINTDKYILEPALIITEDVSHTLSHSKLSGSKFTQYLNFIGDNQATLNAFHTMVYICCLSDKVDNNYCAIDMSELESFYDMKLVEDYTKSLVENKEDILAFFKDI